MSASFCWWCGRKLQMYGKPLPGVIRYLETQCRQPVRLHKSCAKDFDAREEKITAQEKRSWSYESAIARTLKEWNK